jgi:predicted TIM-barrel fold metal-dependent hydrolase
MVTAMNEAGVDGALLVSPFTLYGYDPSYALEVYAAHPDRFALIKPVDPADPGVVDTIAAWRATDGAVAVRIIMRGVASGSAADVGINRILAAASLQGLPVNLFCWGCLERVKELAAQHPNTQLVIDHLGLQQPFEPPPRAAPFAELPKLLALARYDNVALKISGVCTLSREQFPYNDLWHPLCRIFEAFGFDRCMWGTDWTRAVAFATYKQAVDAFRLTDRLSEDERAKLMGGTLSRIYDWAPASKGPLHIRNGI